MTHIFNLNPGPFHLIKNHLKDVEMRTNDERRKRVSVGDYIIFKNTKENAYLLVKVLKKCAFKDFFELYNHYEKNRIGYLDNETADPHDMYQYYSEELIQKYGALAIEIALIEDIKIASIDEQNQEISIFTKQDNKIEKLSFEELEKHL